MKVAKQKEKEWQKAQNRKERNGTATATAAGHQVNGQSKEVAGSRGNIQFPNNVVLLEAAARNDIVEVSCVSVLI